MKRIYVLLLLFTSAAGVLLSCTPATVSPEKSKAVFLNAKPVKTARPFIIDMLSLPSFM